MSEAPDVQQGLDRYRAVRRQLEEQVLPLATSVDGRRFTFQASLHGLALRPGGYVALEPGRRSRLGQVLALELGDRRRAELAWPARTATTRSRADRVRPPGEGALLEGDGAPFHDATVRPATPDEVRAWLERAAPGARLLEIGELALAPGVPFALDAGGFDRHTFLCGQSGSGKTYSLGVVLERVAARDRRCGSSCSTPTPTSCASATVRDGADPAAAERYAAARRRSASTPPARTAASGCASGCARSSRPLRRRCCASTRSPIARSTPSSPTCWRDGRRRDASPGCASSPRPRRRAARRAARATSASTS